MALTNAARLAEAWITVPWAPTITLPARFGTHFAVTLTNNAILDPPLEPHPGQFIWLRIAQDATGSRTLTPNAAIVSRGTVVLNATASSFSLWLLTWDEDLRVWSLWGVPDLSATYDAAGAASAAVATHEAASDPHPGYLTPAEGNAAYQPLDATLTAFAALTIVANSVTVGSGTDTFTQLTLGANTIPGRSSAGNILAKTCTDFGFSLIDDADAAAGRATLGIADDTGFSITGASDTKVLDMSGFTGDTLALAKFVSALFSALKLRKFPVA